MYDIIILVRQILTDCVHEHVYVYVYVYVCIYTNIYRYTYCDKSVS